MQPLRGGDLLSASAQFDTDLFRIYCYKIVPCAKKFGHDWSECPFAHEGEKATRRCPALYLYSSIVCPDVRQSKPCPRGDVCPYSHSIFEYWMHPARFRAQLCSFGAECNRRICFFAHAQDQLRVPSEPVVTDALASRAPYLQGRVGAKSRYALYPEQVPTLMPLHGGGMGQQLPAGGDAGPAQAQVQPGLQQLVYLPALHSGQGGMVAAPGPGGQVAALQQQAWPGGGPNLVYVPAPQPGGAMGAYYMAAGGGGAPAGAALAPYAGAVQQALPGQASPGGGYSVAQPVPLAMATLPDGAVAYAQAAPAGAVFAAGPGPPVSSGVSLVHGPPPPGGPHAGQHGAPPQQQHQGWVPQAQQVQVQPPGGAPGPQHRGGAPRLLMPAAEGGEGAAAAGIGTAAEGYVLAPPQRPLSAAAVAAAQHGLAGPTAAVDSAGGYVLPAGPTVVQAPVGGLHGSAAGGGALVPQQPQQPAGSSSQAGGSEGGATRAPVDDLTQQMGGWRLQ